jgi:hypothetical protein
MSKTEQPVWSYGTQHVDVMLWNYCLGLFDLIPRLDKEKAVLIFDQHVTGKISQIKAIYDLTPSFTVTLIITHDDGVKYEMKKIPVEK